MTNKKSIENEAKGLVGAGEVRQALERGLECSPKVREQIMDWLKDGMDKSITLKDNEEGRISCGSRCVTFEGQKNSILVKDGIVYII